MSELDSLYQELQALAEPERVEIMQRFFKTGPGEYAEGDVLIGIRVPNIRKTAKKYKHLALKDVKLLISSDIHEYRMAALVILMEQYKKAKEETGQKKIYNFYISNMRYINNWDLIDVSIPHIVGHFLFTRDKSLLEKWARHQNMWYRRMAIMTTFYFIRQNHYSETIHLAHILVNDKEDLIHKAVGWMLREIASRHMPTAEKFLKRYYKTMPRTMLRYAIEKFPQQKRKAYMSGADF